jgi:type I restriction enzyme, S subunit
LLGGNNANGIFPLKYYSGKFNAYQRTYVIESRNREVLLTRYLYYALMPALAHFRSASIGAATQYLTKPILDNFKITLQNVQIQRKIVDIISAYDDLIANNRNRIQLLEQAARQIYKEWFVRLRFPGHEHTHVVDGVPVGWEKSTISDVCLEFSDGDWIETKDQGGEDYRLLQISNIGENDFVETGNYRYITEETLRRLRCNEVVPGDILISRMPTPIGRAWYVTEMPWRMITAVDVTIARPNFDKVNPFYYLFHLNSEKHLAYCAVRATGATRPRIARKSMAGSPILVPTKHLQEIFGEFAKANHEMKTRLKRQIELLEQARDLLLPRLMNGVISV